MFDFKSMIYSRFIKWWNKKFIFIRRLPWEYGFIRKEKNIIEKEGFRNASVHTYWKKYWRLFLTTNQKKETRKFFTTREGAKILIFCLFSSMERNRDHCWDWSKTMDRFSLGREFPVHFFERKGKWLQNSTSYWLSLHIHSSGWLLCLNLAQSELK